MAQPRLDAAHPARLMIQIVEERKVSLGEVPDIQTDNGAPRSFEV